MKKTLFLLFALSISLWAFAQADLCEESDPFCTSDTYVFPAGTSGNSAQPGPNYGCLSTTPNPAWYHMKIGVPGDIEITMYSEPAYDIDFICWGPFSDPVLPCEGQLTAFKTVDCSYAGGTAPEICNIPNGLEGEYYILLITNFSQQECDIIFEKTGGSGETDCGIVPPQVSNNGPLCVGETLELYATDEPGATYEWSGPMGFTSNDQNPVIPNVVLGNAGDYQLIITVGGVSSDPVITNVVITDNPVPGFSFLPSSDLCVNEIISFSGVSTETIAQWEWDFGDGNTASVQNPTHAYLNSGYKHQ